MANHDKSWHRQVFEDETDLLARQKKMQEARTATVEMRVRAVEQRKLAGDTCGGKTAVIPPHHTTHTVQTGETLADIALRYFGSATRDKWMPIYELNKPEIGNDPAFIQPGQRLQIPTLT
jgi:nucleoid-associated protein YgaU